jgi:NADP-dependent 3-hydroxy acid dehydrogenase YdfG
MTDIPYRSVLIVGAGSGISASLARALSAEGLRVGLAARNVKKLASLASETKAQTFAVDASDPAAVATMFEDADVKLGEIDIVVYNASTRVTGPDRGTQSRRCQAGAGSLRIWRLSGHSAGRAPHDAPRLWARFC